MTAATLVLNAGSSSLKFAVFEQTPSPRLLMRGNVSQIHDAPRLTVSTGDGRADERRALGAGPIGMASALESVVAEIAERGLEGDIVAIGHRIVHGGRDFTAARLLDQSTLEVLRGLVALAPLHQPRNLEVVEHSAALFPGAIQAGCFDTAFHAGRPHLATLYGLPRALTESGLVSYGFHGISYAYIASQLAQRYGAAAGARTIVAHLGSGASMCAMLGGKSVATTMGFSTLDGLVMSSRCGALDPGIVIHLLQDRKMSVEGLTRLLYEESGLLGISGISGNMQTLLESDDPAAAAAVDLFVYRAGREIGSLAAAIGGLDTLVFTAGIGENAPVIRERICQAAGWLGVKLDRDRNERGEERIGAEGSPVEILVMATDEERAVAEQIGPLLDGSNAT
jgi:acetate kinase